jgi:hypothetical protein
MNRFVRLVKLVKPDRAAPVWLEGTRRFRLLLGGFGLTLAQSWSSARGERPMHFTALVLQVSPDPATAQKMALAVLALFPIIMLVGMAIVIVPFWFICKKAGLSPWLSFLNVIPLGILILLYIVAFAEWKVVPAPFEAQGPYPPFPPYPPAYPPSIPPTFPPSSPPRG